MAWAHAKGVVVVTYVFTANPLPFSSYLQVKFMTSYRIGLARRSPVSAGIWAPPIYVCYKIAPSFMKIPGSLTDWNIFLALTKADIAEIDAAGVIGSRRLSVRTFLRRAASVAFVGALVLGICSYAGIDVLWEILRLWCESNPELKAQTLVVFGLICTLVNVTFCSF